MKKFLLLNVILWPFLHAHAQTGPNNPATAANVAGIGVNAWVNPTNCFSSNNVYSTVVTKGLTNYLQATNFGFAIAAPAAIDGIKVEIEKSTTGSSNVTLLDGWSTGTTKTISAGTNRCLVVIYGQENGTDTRDLLTMKYGGQAMTNITQMVLGSAGGFNDRIEAWYLNEAGIAAAGSTTITVTYAAGITLTEYCEVFSAATFSNVDQLAPIYDQTASGINSGTDPHQLGTALNTLVGSMSINGVVCGNNTTPAVTLGGTNTYTINLGYTEGTDYYFSTVAPATGNASGACLETAHLSNAAIGTVQPTCDFNGTVNRHVMVGFVLQRARELDNEVRIVKAGTITGSNLASAAAWSTADAYTTYGGPAVLWGTTWVLTDVTAANFGAAIASRSQNGTMQVDHIRITIYSHSTLPIELLDFSAKAEQTYVDLNWVTATEVNNDYFLVQRSLDGISFENISQVPGAGNSNSTRFYNLKDYNPVNGTMYYRLKQVDFNGEFDYSPIRTVNFQNNQLVVFPNPTLDGNITIYNGSIGINEVAVYSSDLRLVKKCTLNKNQNPIVNIEDCADGTYFLLVKTEKESQIVKVMRTTRDK
jgi:hypothetical protein